MRIVAEGRLLRENVVILRTFYKEIQQRTKLPSEVRVQQSSRTYTRTLSCFRFMLMLRPLASGGANRRSEASLRYVKRTTYGLPLPQVIFEIFSVEDYSRRVAEE